MTDSSRSTRSQVMLFSDGIIERHLVEDLARMGVAPGEADALREILDQLPVLARLAGRADDGTADLHLAVGVGEGAPFLRMGGGRQDHVGEPRRLGEEDVLDDEVLQMGERLADMALVGVRHGRVLAHDVHALDAALMHGVA